MLNFRSDALLEDGSGVVAHPRYDIEERPVEALKLPYNATVTPLQVHLPSAPPRPPTLAECEVIMKHMQQTNDRQAHEVIPLYNDMITARRLSGKDNVFNRVCLSVPCTGP